VVGDEKGDGRNSKPLDFGKAGRTAAQQKRRGPIFII